MTNGTIERFLESAALKLPAIIKPRLENRTAREVYDDYALLDFPIPEALAFENFCNELGESYAPPSFTATGARKTPITASRCVPFRNPAPA